MPSLTFVLPHWLYWAGLAVFPFIAIMLVRRERQRGPGHGVNVFTAYLFWLTAGFLGMHRFYLKSLWGFLFIPFFLVILWGNDHIRDAREDVSRTRQQHEVAARALGRAEDRLKAGRSGASAEIVAVAREKEQTAKAAFDGMQAELQKWNRFTSGTAIVLALLLLGDAALMPRLVRRAREREGDPRAEVTVLPEAPQQGTVEATSAHVRTRFTDAIDRFNQAIGTYVAYWAVIAVFVYYYEVLARYVFNSPTNWVHESMFLMFGMQYLYCGAYAYREDSHVRVDVFYAKLSPRGRAMADIVTSLFFFIFTGTMFWTGMRFALDAIGVGEHSFTEWGVQYWPVKLALPIGALLILLQGVSKLIKDVVFVLHGAAPTAAVPAGTHLGA
jgi:TRAP-type mannitol/chloroaromatic compound transport system permease small subunit